MSLSETMTALMNAARTKFPLISKLGVKDLTQVLLSKVVINEQQIAMTGANPGPNGHMFSSARTAQIYPTDAAKYSINVQKGQRVMQSVVIQTDGVLSSSYISFYENGKGHHNVTASVTKLGDRSYKLAADYVSDFNGSMLLQDINTLRITGGTYFDVLHPYVAVTQVGGVKANLLLDPINFTDWENNIGSTIDTVQDGDEKALVLPNNGVRLDCSKIGVIQGVPYAWSFWARADNDGDKIHNELWGGVGSKDFKLATTWRFYSSSGIGREYPMFYFWGLDSNKGNVYVKIPYLTTK